MRQRVSLRRVQRELNNVSTESPYMTWGGAVVLMMAIVTCLIWSRGFAK